MFLLTLWRLVLYAARGWTMRQTASGEPRTPAGSGGKLTLKPSAQTTSTQTSESAALLHQTLVWPLACHAALLRMQVQGLYTVSALALLFCDAE